MRACEALLEPPSRATLLLELRTTNSCDAFKFIMPNMNYQMYQF